MAGAARLRRGGLLAAGFFWHRSAHSLLAFYIAMVLSAAGYSFTGNVPRSYLISGWFEAAPRDDRRLYDAGCGRRGGRPSIVEAIVRLGGWRGHWQAWPEIAVALLVRPSPSSAMPKVPDAPRTAGISGVPCSAAILLIAAVMTATMACVTTNPALR